MEFISRVMTTMAKTDAETIDFVVCSDEAMTLDAETEDGIWLEPPAWAFRWKRLVTMVKVVMIHAESGSIIKALGEQRIRMELDAKKEYERLSGKTMATKNAKTQMPMTPQAKGKPLARSQAGPWIATPEMCTHLQHLTTRGGRGGHKWITCMECGARWDRVPVEEVTDEEVKIIMDQYHMFRNQGLAPNAATTQVLIQNPEQPYRTSFIIQKHATDKPSQTSTSSTS